MRDDSSMPRRFGFLGFVSSSLSATAVLGTAGLVLAISDSGSKQPTRASSTNPAVTQPDVQVAPLPPLAPTAPTVRLPQVPQAPTLVGTYGKRDDCHADIRKVEPGTNYAHGCIYFTPGWLSGESAAFKSALLTTSSSEKTFSYEYKAKGERYFTSASLCVTASENSLDWKNPPSNNHELECTSAPLDVEGKSVEFFKPIWKEKPTTSPKPTVLINVPKVEPAPSITPPLAAQPALKPATVVLPMAESPRTYIERKDCHAANQPPMGCTLEPKETGKGRRFVPMDIAQAANNGKIWANFSYLHKTSWQNEAQLAFGSKHACEVHYNISARNLSPLG